MDQYEYYDLKKDVSDILGKQSAEFIDKHKNDEELLYKLKGYID